MNASNDTATRYIGFCPVCEGKFKLHGGKLVHHGYERPGDGMIHGDCFTVGMEPHETSPKAAQDFKAACENRLVDAQAYLVRLQNGEITTFTTMSSPWEKTRTVTTVTAERKVVKNLETKEEKVTTGIVAEYEFKQATERAIRKIEMEIKGIESHIRRMDGHLTDWAPKPVVTFDESVAQVKAAKEEAKSERLAAKRVKATAKVASFQKRIDSAMKRVGGKGGESTLSDIWESTSRHYETLGFATQAELLTLIDRPAVWAKFSLVPDVKYRTADWDVQEAKLSAMRYSR